MDFDEKNIDTQPLDIKPDGCVEEQVQAEELKKDNTFLEYLRDFTAVMVVIMLMFFLFFRIIVVSGPSMNDTLEDGDMLLLVSRVFYRNPKQGDIIVASKGSFRNGEPIIKRIIATEGQVVDIDFNTGAVYVDGVLLEETEYIKGSTKNPEGVRFPLTVDEGHVFVMGDNREDSLDSRSKEIGLIDERQILGKAIFLIYPGKDRDLGRIGVLN